MIVIEMRDAAYDNAFDLLEEAKHNAKKTKLTLCKLEDAMYECYEASKDDTEDYEPTEESDVDFRSRKGYRHDEDDMRDDDTDINMRSAMRRANRRHAMRMRRNRIGQFV